MKKGRTHIPSPNQKGLKVLGELSFNAKKESSTMPAHCIPRTKYSDKTANGLTRCIIDYLRLTGNQAERISNTGRMLDQRRTVTDVVGRQRTIGSTKWIKGSGTRGTSDISSVINGRAVKIEVKIGRDTQSPAQKAYQESIESSGGIYIVARNFQGFYDWYIAFIEGFDSIKDYNFEVK